MNNFNVTYEIVTPESAEQGDAEERGFIAENVSLREAIQLINETRTCHVGGQTAVEASATGDPASADWFTIYNGMEYMTGASENRSLHFPNYITGASRGRLFKLLGVSF